MKILSNKDIKSNWPIGGIFLCTSCGCEFKIEHYSEYNKVIIEKENTLIHTNCPNCKKLLSFWEFK